MGMLYPVIYYLETHGFITSRVEQIAKRRTRIYFHLEPKGRELLEQLRKEYRQINKGVEYVLDSTEF